MARSPSDLGHKLESVRIQRSPTPISTAVEIKEQIVWFFFKDTEISSFGLTPDRPGESSEIAENDRTPVRKILICASWKEGGARRPGIISLDQRGDLVGCRKRVDSVALSALSGEEQAVFIHEHE